VTLAEALYRRRPPFPWNVVSLLLAPFGALYGALMRLRAAVYRRRAVGRRRPAFRAISVGNLTLGGSGKTPVTAFLAEKLQGQGRRVAVVCRGYRGSLEGRSAVVADGEKLLLDAAQAGDEPVMLARRLPGVPVVIGARRVEAAALAAERFGAEVVVCDDAFSHLALPRDVDLVLVHGRDGLGNGRCTPAGPLREPPRALRRATAILLNVSSGEDPAVADELRRAGVQCPIFRFRYGKPVLRRRSDGEPLDPAQMADPRVVAFAGTARPADFFASLAAAGWNVAAAEAFRDHHAYTETDLARLAQLAAARGICYLAATEKDAVKLPAAPGVEILVARVDLAWDGDDGEALLARASGQWPVASGQ
jgi:tetraacyldisaccharide 4'-kinase